MPFLFNDPTFLLLIPAMIFAIWAQMRVSSTYKKYSAVASAQGISGAKAADYLLQRNGISDVTVEAVEGTLSDHYDPRTKKVRLSEQNYRGRSLSALAVAAHEVGPKSTEFRQRLPISSSSSLLAIGTGLRRP